MCMRVSYNLSFLCLFQTADNLLRMNPLPALYVYESVELELSLTTVSLDTDESIYDYFSCPIQLHTGLHITTSYYLLLAITNTAIVNTALPAASYNGALKNSPLVEIHIESLPLIEIKMIHLLCE